MIVHGNAGHCTATCALNTLAAIASIPNIPASLQIRMIPLSVVLICAFKAVAGNAVWPSLINGELVSGYPVLAFAAPFKRGRAHANMALMAKRKVVPVVENKNTFLTVKQVCQELIDELNSLPKKKARALMYDMQTRLGGFPADPKERRRFIAGN